MKSELKFNSQVCTTKEQSQRLLDLGLKPETADCMYSVMTKSYNGRYILEEDRQYNLILFRQEDVQSVGFSHYEHIPAWSLHRLIEMYNSVGDGSLLQFEDITYKLVINCICMAIATGSFPKQYLNE